jgi:hypothetical protein
MRAPNSSPRTRVATIAGLLAALGSAILVAPPASAATVLQVHYSSEFAQGYTSALSADGCTYSSTAAGAGTMYDGGTAMFYSSSTYNKCTGEGYSTYGEAPTELFDFARSSVHATATVPLSDGTEIYLDLTWQGTGTVERGGSISRDILPGQFVQRNSIRGTTQQAVVTGTLSFENAFISASTGSSMQVIISNV